MKKMSKIYKYKIVRMRKSRKGEPIGNAYHSFVASLGILKDFNKIIPELFEKYKDGLREDQRNQIGQLDAVGKKEYEKYVQLWNSAVKKNFKTRTVSMTNRKLLDLLEEQYKLILHSSRFDMFIKEMSLVYLITEFEQFLGRILSIVFTISPGYLISSQKTMTYQEILLSDGIDNLKEKIIEQEINSLISQDIEYIRKDLESKFKFNIGSLTDYNKIKERFYRRNIVIHNNCYPDAKYRKKAGYKGAGVRLSITQGYLISSINLFSKFAGILKGFLEEKAGANIG